jgi:hypothetical protein
MTTRALHRPRPIERPANPFIEAAFEELHTRPNEHTFDYDALAFASEAYDPLPIGVHAPGQDNWGRSLSAPAPVHQPNRGWHDRR